MPGRIEALAHSLAWSSRPPLADEVLVGPLGLGRDEHLPIPEFLDVVGIGRTAFISLPGRLTGLELHAPLLDGHQRGSRPEIVRFLREKVPAQDGQLASHRHGGARLWPIPLPDADGRQNEWHRTAAIAASLAVKTWLRVASNRDLGGYEVFEAANQPPDPEWPDLDLQHMLHIAFRARGRIIESSDHPVVKQLLGRL